MRAVTYRDFGGPDVLEFIQMTAPIPHPDQVLIRVKACGLNRADVLQRKGKYPPPPNESKILGLEVAGEVVGLGAKVKHHKLGDRVFGLVASAAYAEYCAIDQDLALPIPHAMSYIEAAAIAEAFLTAQEALFSLGNLQAGETVLIHAGAGGVGSAAIQLAHYSGATVYTTVGTPEKAVKAQKLGASAAILYKEMDFALEVAQLTEDKGVNLIIDFVGGNYLEQHLLILQEGGRLITLGLMGGAKAEIDLRFILNKRLQMKGLTMRNRPLDDKRIISKHFQSHWLPVFEQGNIKPVIDSVFSFDEVAQAHQRMEDNLNIGKIILELEEA